MGIPEDVARLELELRELIIKYEQYFLGIEKREPLRLLDEVERLVRRYRNISIPNTMQRFKYDSLAASFSVHKQKWTRINRLIEDGKYQRDLFKMSLTQAEGANRQPDLKDGGSSAREVDKIYQEYRGARLACNLPVDSLTHEMIAQAIERQKPAILEKYRCSDVSFVVVVENGKPRLKARPKRGQD